MKTRNALYRGNDGQCRKIAIEVIDGKFIQRHPDGLKEETPVRFASALHIMPRGWHGMTGRCLEFPHPSLAGEVIVSATWLKRAGVQIPRVIAG